MRTERSSIALATAIAFVIAPAIARADEPVAGAKKPDTTSTMVEINSGFLLLPGALVCPQTLDPATCKRGEFSLVVGIQNIWLWHDFGFGGGIQWATTLRSDAAQGEPELERSHSRRYFLVEAQARYYFINQKRWRGFAGVTIGGIIVNDSWSVKADREPYADTAFIGPRAATLGTEGLTMGAFIGGEWTFAPNWSLGPSLRYSTWFLPDARKQSPTLDVASLSGRLDMIDVGLRIAYRIAL
ncbi:Hypothetical protein A7982_07205 [Minicystis rosea]|nr:Hypothetical protein A7982_07205 [Minicystis rosea]